MTDTQLVQLLIGDTAGAHYTVLQIQAFLDMSGGEVKLAAALALEAWAAELAQGMASETIGDYEYRRADMLAVAKRLREEAISEPASAVAAFDWEE